MEIIFKDLQSRIHQKLKAACSVTIAVAYFRPDAETLKILSKVPKVKIIVSKEFDKSDPYKLEELTLTHEHHKVKCIPVFPNRLHAKIIFGENEDGNCFASVGSANLTSDGLSRNKEVSVMFDSNTESDQDALRDISTWLENLYNESSDIDFNEAKIIFNNKSKISFRGKSPSVVPTNNWTIKTRDGQGPEAVDYWNKFLAEEIIALGWGGELKIDPRTVTDLKLRQLIKKKYGHMPSSKAGRIAKEIMRFSGQQNGIQINDIVWIIGSFTPNQKNPVNIYGVSIVTGDLQPNWESPWWNFKRSAKIFPIEREIDIGVVKTCFIKPGKGDKHFSAMGETLYQVHNNSFERLCTEIHKVHGITINL